MTVLRQPAPTIVAGTATALPQPAQRPWPTQADLGGRHDAGPLDTRPETEPFHADWERRVFALTLAMGATGAWNLDMSRATRETLPGYSQLGYYGIWLEALERLLVSRGLLTEAECAGIPDGAAAAAAVSPPTPLGADEALPAPSAPGRVLRVLTAEAVPGVLRRGAPTHRPAAAAARFAVGDLVRTRAEAADHHTRLPGYARGRRGTVERVHGAHVLPDSHAHDQGEAPAWLYTVRFDASELWGARTSASTVALDLWEPYLQPADGAEVAAP